MTRSFPSRAIWIAAAMMLSLIFCSCGQTAGGPESSSESKVEYVIRLGHSDTEDNLINVSLQHYADYVKENTEGRVVIRLYPNEELGDNTDMAQQTPCPKRPRISSIFGSSPMACTPFRVMCFTVRSVPAGQAVPVHCRLLSGRTVPDTSSRAEGSGPSRPRPG